MATNISTIGSTGRDYSTIPTWESATDNDLVTAGDIEVGEMYDDSDFTTDAATFSGATTDSSNYRILRAASGEEFDPVAGTGVEVVIASIGVTRVHQISEDWFQLGPNIGYDVTTTDNAAGAVIDCLTAVEGILLERLFVKGRNSGSYNVTYVGIEGTTAPGAAETHPTIRNCIVVSETGTQDDIDDCIKVNNSYNVWNCVTYNGDNGIVSSSHTDIDWRNNIAVDAGTNDFSRGSGTATNDDYNASSDITATGANSITSQTSTDLFETPGSDDFTLKSGSNAIDDGVDLSGSFTDDYDGTTRSGTWDMGAYDSAGGGTPYTKAAAVLDVTISKPTPSYLHGSTISVGAKDVTVELPGAGVPHTEAVAAQDVTVTNLDHLQPSRYTKSAAAQVAYVWQQGRTTTKWNPVGGSNTTTIQTPADVTFKDMMWLGAGSGTAIVKTTSTWGRATAGSPDIADKFWSGHLTFDNCWVYGSFDPTDERDGSSGIQYNATKWGFHTYDNPKLTIKNCRIEGIKAEHAYYDHVHCSTLPSLTHRVLQNNFIRWCGRTAFQHVARSGSVAYPGAEGLDPNPPDGSGGGLIEIRDNYIEDVCITTGGGGSALTLAGGMPSIDAIIDNNTIRMGCNTLMSGADRQDIITGCLAVRFERESQSAPLGKEGRCWGWTSGHAIKTLTITNNDFEVGKFFSGAGSAPRRMLDLQEIETLIIGTGNRFVKSASAFATFIDPVIGEINCNSSEYHAGTNTTYTGEIGTVYLTHPTNMTSHGRWVFTRPDGTSNTYGPLYGDPTGYELMFDAECDPTGGPGGNCYPLDDWPL